VLLRELGPIFLFKLVSLDALKEVHGENDQVENFPRICPLSVILSMKLVVAQFLRMCYPS